MNRIFKYFKVPPHKILINYEKSNFAVKEPDRPELNEVIKANILSHGTNRNYIPLDYKVQKEEHSSINYHFLPKNA